MPMLGRPVKAVQPLRISPVGPEERAQILCVELGLLERREVPPARQLGPADDVRRALCPRPRWDRHVAREHGDAARHLDAAGVLGDRDLRGVVIQTERGPDRLRQPVDRDVRQELVLGEAETNITIYWLTET